MDQAQPPAPRGGKSQSTVPPAPRRVLLADADAFFVAVARLIDPEGAGRTPLLIVGGTAQGRGVVTSASYEARAYGVRSAMPTGQALRLCPDAMVVPVPRRECTRKSREIFQVLQRFTPVVEPASIDEFYLDLSGTERLYRHQLLADTARSIRQAVIDDTGLSVSIGGGTNRLIAKLAAQRAKPRTPEADGVFVVPPGGEAAFVRELDLADLPMVGPRFQERLASRGLRTVRQALEHDLTTLAAWFGRRTGEWLYHRIRGEGGSSVVSRSKSRSIGHEETFSRDLVNDADLEGELLHLALTVCADLRGHQLRARTITVKLKDSDFTVRQASRTLPQPVSAERPVHSTALALLRRLRRDRRTPARLLGVSLSQLIDDPADAQLALFARTGAEVIESDRDRTLARAVDDIKGKFGRTGIMRGAQIARRRER